MQDSDVRSRLLAQKQMVDADYAAANFQLKIAEALRASVGALPDLHAELIQFLREKESLQRRGLLNDDAEIFLNFEIKDIVNRIFRALGRGPAFGAARPGRADVGGDGGAGPAAAGAGGPRAVGPNVAGVKRGLARDELADDDADGAAAAAAAQRDAGEERGLARLRAVQERAFGGDLPFFGFMAAPPFTAADLDAIAAEEAAAAAGGRAGGAAVGPGLARAGGAAGGRASGGAGGRAGGAGGAAGGRAELGEPERAAGWKRDRSGRELEGGEQVMLRALLSNPSLATSHNQAAWRVCERLGYRECLRALSMM